MESNDGERGLATTESGRTSMIKEQATHVPRLEPQRYDLVTNYRCGTSIEEMERADEGEWVRYDDMEAARAPRAPLEPVTTFTPLMWVSMTEDQRYEEYTRVREALAAARSALPPPQTGVCLTVEQALDYAAKFALRRRVDNQKCCPKPDEDGGPLWCPPCMDRELEAQTFERLAAELQMRAALPRVPEPDTLDSLLAKLEKFYFPIMDGPKIPWTVIAPHERQAQRNHRQTLLRLAERGGLSPCEAVAVLEDRDWHRMDDKVAKARLDELVRAARAGAEAPPTNDDQAPRVEPSSTTPAQGSTANNLNGR